MQPWMISSLFLLISPWGSQYREVRIDEALCLRENVRFACELAAVSVHTSPGQTMMPPAMTAFDPFAHAIAAQITPPFHSSCLHPSYSGNLIASVRPKTVRTSPWERESRLLRRGCSLSSERSCYLFSNRLRSLGYWKAWVEYQASACERGYGDSCLQVASDSRIQIDEDLTAYFEEKSCRAGVREGCLRMLHHPNVNRMLYLNIACRLGDLYACDWMSTILGKQPPVRRVTDYR